MQTIHYKRVACLASDQLII